jgi:hypothetical protein
MTVVAIGALVMQTIPFTNVEIAVRQGGGGFSPCEPSVAISRTDPRIVVAGAVLDNVMRSVDGGKSWTQERLKSEYGVFGDPALISDFAGNFYYFHLANPGPNNRWLERIVCQKSADGGKSFMTIAGLGHNPPKHQDKEWPAVHPTKPHIAATWTQFDKYGAKELNFKSNIMFSISQDSAKNWSKAVAINDISGDCVDGDDTTEGAVPAFTRDGAITVVWSAHGVLWSDRSTDGGKTWGVDKPIARHYGGWDMPIPGIGRCNGMPVLMADQTTGQYSGNLYAIYADQLTPTDTDIFLIRSTNGGKSWSEPKRINQDGAGAHQYFPWLAVDQQTGHLYAVYYDRRGCEGNDTNVYVAWSTDGGQTFRERRVNRDVIPMTVSGFFGDYNNIAAESGLIVPIWTGVKGGQTSIWVAPIRHDELAKSASGSR